jgi:hypothetical protein
VQLPPEYEPIQNDLAERLSSKTIVRIRNEIAFHYPRKPLDFRKLNAHLDDTDATLFLVPEGYEGDILMHLSTLAGMEPLLVLNSSDDYRVALKAVWEEVTEVAGIYCRLVSELIATLIMKYIPGVPIIGVIVPDAPAADETSLRFFVHPPGDLREIRAAVAIRDD